MFQIILISIFTLLEIPFFIKLLKAHRECELTREVAILVIMLIIAFIIFGIFMLG